MTRIVLQAPKARDGSINQPRVGYLELLVAKSQLVHCARAQVFDDHVRDAYQVLQDLAPSLLAQVEGQTLLVAVVADKAPGHPAPAFVRGVGWDRPARIPSAGHLDFDHFGSSIGQEHGTVGRAHVLFQANHTHTGQWASYSLHT